MTLSKYLLAENEIRLIFYRYYGSSSSDLKKSNIILDVEAYLKKWCREIPALRNIKKDLRQAIKDCEKEDDLKDEAIINAYQMCISNLFEKTYFINAERLQRQAFRIINKIEEGIDSYYYNMMNN